MTSYGLIAVLVIGLWSSSSDGKPRSRADGPLDKRQATGCGQTGFYNDEGFIKTPNYPSDYANNLDCTYTIESIATIQYVSFYTCDCYIESVSGCYYDYIQFGSDKLCGQQSRQSYYVYPNASKVDVLFHSDGSVVHSGCNVAYGVNKPAYQLVNNCPATTPSSNFTTFPSWNYTTPSSNFTNIPSWNYTTPSWNSPPNSTNWDIFTTALPINGTVSALINAVLNMEAILRNDFLSYQQAVWAVINHFNSGF